MNAEKMFDLFVNRKDIFAEQLPNGAYLPVRREISVEDVEKHLKGEKTIGVYQVGKDNRVKWGCIDFDKPCQEGKAFEIFEFFKENEFSCMFEESGGLGHFHVWFFSEMGALVMRELLLLLIQGFGLKEGRDRRRKEGMSDEEWNQVLVDNELNVEVFPKTKELLNDSQVGFLVKLPLGFNKKAKNWSKIVESWKV